MVDAAGRNATGVDKNQSYGGRVSVLYQPTDNFSARLSAQMQNIRVDSPGSFTVDPLSVRRSTRLPASAPAASACGTSVIRN